MSLLSPSSSDSDPDEVDPDSVLDPDSDPDEVDPDPVVDPDSDPESEPDPEDACSSLLLLRSELSAQSMKSP